jgi:outer membrane lipoprotein carrier protein
LIRFDKILFLFFALFFFGQIASAYQLSSKTASMPDDLSLSLDEIITHVEKRYSVSGFSAQFFQTSTIKAMDITDTASGTAYFKRPGKMRWKYEAPERQTLITDGNTLWIYRPDDNQVMIGKAPSFFKGGKGFSFLSDMKEIRQKFKMSLEKEGPEGFWVLKLLPKEKTVDIVKILLTISKATFDVVEIATYNSYGDQTRFVFSHIQFKKKIDDSLFHFNIPKDVEVLHLDEQGGS